MDLLYARYPLDDADTLLVQAQADYPDERIAAINESLGSTLSLVSGFAGDFDYLVAAVKYLEDSLGLRPPGHPDSAVTLRKLAAAQLRLHEFRGSPGHLHMAIKNYQNALRALPLSCQERSAALSELGVALRLRFASIISDDSDLDAAIDIHQQELELRQPGHPARSASLCNLGYALYTRFRHAGEHTDVAAAIAYYEEALPLDPPGHPQYSITRTYLSLALQTRFTSSRGQLDDANVLQRQAFTNLPEGSFSNPFTRLIRQQYLLSRTMEGEIRWACQLLRDSRMNEGRYRTVGIQLREALEKLVQSLGRSK